MQSAGVNNRIEGSLPTRTGMDRMARSHASCSVVVASTGYAVSKD